MKVNIEYILELQEKRREFNKLNLSEIEFYKNGQLIIIEKDLLDDWRFTGLSNTDFVEEIDAIGAEQLKKDLKLC